MNESSKSRVWYQNSPLYFRLRPRRFHAFCVGMAKTGTHSVSALFERNYRAQHEPESKLVVRTILAAADGTLDKAELDRFVQRRDKRLWLEMDSSHFNYYFLDELLCFPQAKFILTIRDCYSWLDSYLNHQLNYPPHKKSAQTASDWQRFRDLRFATTEQSHAPQEQVLAEHGLYNLDGYLSCWREHNTRVLESVPQSQLLVIRTNDIAKEAEKIARFLQVEPQTLDSTTGHSFPNKREKYNLLSQIERGFVEEKVERYCQPLMSEFFPQVRALEDVVK